MTRRNIKRSTWCLVLSEVIGLSFMAVFGLTTCASAAGRAEAAADLVQ